jgi:hypothetical protein
MKVPKKVSLVFVSLLLMGNLAVQAQKYLTKNATISFTSKAPLETIEAKNKTVTAVIDSKSGAIAFSTLVKGFVFDKALMQQHFNENYMESGKYPKSEFKGTITNNADIKYGVNGTYNATVSGKLTIHGQTKDITTTGKVTVTNGKISAIADFNVTLEDYKISIPGVVKDKISKTVKISVSTGNMDALK